MVNLSCGVDVDEWVNALTSVLSMKDSDSHAGDIASIESPYAERVDGLRHKLLTSLQQLSNVEVFYHRAMDEYQFPTMVETLYYSTWQDGWSSENSSIVIDVRLCRVIAEIEASFFTSPVKVMLFLLAWMDYYMRLCAIALTQPDEAHDSMEHDFAVLVHVFNVLLSKYVDGDDNFFVLCLPVVKNTYTDLVASSVFNNDSWLKLHNFVQAYHQVVA